MKCIACGSSDLTTVLKLKDAARVSMPLSRRNLAGDRTVPLTVLSCNTCTLVQLGRPIGGKQAYYEHYFLDRTFSNFSDAYQKAISKHFISAYGLAGKSVIDVGSGDGTVAKMLSDEGAKVTGMDPSAEACEVARKKGIRVIEGALTPKSRIAERFDGFTCCQVLEHMDHPVTFLKSVIRILAPGAVGMIEIPSLSKTLKEGRFYDFFPDHIAYYTSASLSRLLRSVGFRILELKKTMSDEYLVAFVRYEPESTDKRSLQEFYETFRLSVRRFMRPLAAKKVALWGAGIRGVPLVSAAGLNEQTIRYCVDSDPSKQGKYLPGSHIPVVSPQTITADTPDVIIITASLYTKDIMRTLKDKYHYTRKIAALFPSPRFIRHSV